MTPTPAQIEAAADAINHALFDCGAKRLSLGEYDEKAIAKAALTAAAEVVIHPPSSGNLRMTVAAAEVGEPIGLAEQTYRKHYEIERLRQQNADTIERCAQVAEGCSIIDSCHTIAAAIRALKDKP